ncbi:MAG: hypothetical protein MJK18_12255, partial [Bdellovibrionales bacterium]|nr:hypothetical protein [Bdellovibrionales bacterium]
DDLLFPKAQYVVGEEAWKRAQAPHFRDRASFVPLLNQKLSESNRLYIVKNLEAPEELKEIIGFFESNGHTPGQLHTVVKGQNSHVVFAGDLFPGTPWVHLPITMGYDRFPEKLIEEKQQLYTEFSDKQWQVFFTHDSQYAMGKIEKN